MKFKVGDRVKQIHNVSSSENPLATITKIKGDRIFHRHDGGGNAFNSGSKDFISLKITNWRKRIENGL